MADDNERAASAEDSPAAEYRTLLAAIQNTHARIPDRATVHYEARVSRRANRLRLFILWLTAIAVVLTLAGGTAFLAQGAAVVVWFAGLPFIVFAMALSVWRRPRDQTIWGHSARLRRAFWRAVKAAKQFERRYSQALGELVAEAKKQAATAQPAPTQIQAEIVRAAQECARLVAQSESNPTVEGLFERGRRLDLTRRFYWVTAFIFAISIVSSAAAWALFATGNLPRFDSSSLAALTIVAIASCGVLALAPLVALSLDNGFRSDAHDAIRFSKSYSHLRRLLSDVDRRFGKSTADMLDAAVTEAFEEKSVGHGRRKSQRDQIETRLFADLGEAEARARARANWQVGLGGALALGSLLLILGSYFFDLRSEYLERSRLELTGCIEETCTPASASAVATAMSAQRQESFVLVLTTKLTIAIGANALAFFFLIGFRKSQADAKFYRNEMSTFQARILALREADAIVLDTSRSEEARRGASRTAAIILARLGGVDRNPVHHNGASNANIQEHIAANVEARILADYLSAGLGQRAARSEA
jgi:hypothetical protein